jgi:GWxTD domain-containing protein
MGLAELLPCRDKGNFSSLQSDLGMRTSIPWTAAVLFCANFASLPARSTPFQLAPAPSGLGPWVRPAPRAEAAPALVATYDESKKSLPRLAETAEARPFEVDYINFIASHNLAFVEFYVQTSYDRLSFTRAGNLYQAVCDVDFYIEDRDGNLQQAQSARDTVKALTYAETRSADNYRVTRFSFSLRPGEYRLRATMTDQETGKTSEVAQKFSARDFSGTSLTLSDLQFSRHIRVDSSASPFVKHNRRIEPNAMHRYGQFASQLFIYYEIYNLAEPVAAAANGDSGAIPIAAADSFRTHFIIHDENGNEIKQLWRSGRKPGNSCVQSLVLPIADLKSGQYMLTVRVFDNQNGSYAESSGYFTVAWSLFSFKDKKFEEILEQMRYIAGRKELQELANLPEEDRQRGLVEFWQRRDPTPATPENELLDEYYRRIAYANRQFSKWLGGEGWKSPQGQIYVTYGPPDQVSRWSNPFINAMNNDGWRQSGLPAEIMQETSLRLKTRRYSQNDGASYEVWEYVHLNRRFVFVDFRGTGSFELIDPIFLSDSWPR